MGNKLNDILFGCLTGVSLGLLSSGITLYLLDYYNWPPILVRRTNADIHIILSAFWGLLFGAIYGKILNFIPSSNSQRFEKLILLFSIFFFAVLVYSISDYMAIKMRFLLLNIISRFIVFFTAILFAYLLRKPSSKIKNKG